jgi:hypothetical protein
MYSSTERACSSASRRSRRAPPFFAILPPSPLINCPPHFLTALLLLTKHSRPIPLPPLPSSSKGLRKSS